MVGAAGLEPATLGLEIIGSEALPRNLSDLGFCPVLQSEAMLRHSTSFGHPFGHLKAQVH
jgi:hypothetical protein